MNKVLTKRQEAFCIKYFETGVVERAAVAAGYSRRSAKDAGSGNLRKPLVMAKLNELRKRAEDEAVIRVVERKRMLSEIARGRITDYLNEAGDGLAVDRDSVNAGAVAEVSVQTRPGREGQEGRVITRLKLHDPVRAIALLNKMEGLYTDAESPGAPAIRISEVVMVRPEPARMEEPNEIRDTKHETRNTKH